MHLQATPPSPAEHTLLWGTHEMLSGRNHGLGHRTSSTKLERTEIIWNMPSGHSDKTKIIHKDIWEIHECVAINTVLNNQWAKEEMIKEIRSYFEVNENENAPYKNLCDVNKVVLNRKLRVVNIYM